MAKPISQAVRIMLDSGAYSAWYHGAPLDLDTYIEYCQRFGKLFESIVALDQIPGANRKAAKSAADVQAAARISHENWLKMRKAGINAIPVFHQGESFDWLDRLIDAGATYVGISPYPRIGQEIILKWLDQVFSRITTAKGEPIIRTHGFGATSHGMITRYPWFSIDSTTWALAAGYGTLIYAPFKLASGALVSDFEQAPLRFSITDRDTAGSRALLHQGPAIIRAVQAELVKIGLDLSMVRNSDRYRAEWNAHYYKQLEASLGCSPFRFRSKSIAPRDKTVVRFDYKPRVIFAEQMGKHEYGRALARVGARLRLISYYESRRYSDVDLSIYCQSGLLPKDNVAPKKRGSQSWIVNRRLGIIKRLKEADPND